MRRVEKSIEVKASPEKEWELLAFDRFPEWQVGFSDSKSVEYTSDVPTLKDKYKVGASAHAVPKKQGGSIKYNFKVTESLENRKITHRMYGKYDALVAFTLDPIEAGTKFTYRVDYETPWGILGKILSPLVHRIMEREVDRDLKGLKSILEKCQ